MISTRQLWAVIWIALVTIAVELVPATAMAHSGHVHLRSSSTATAYDRAANIELQLKAEHAAVVVRPQAENATRAAITATSNDCCCCASGFSCCTPAILADPIPRFPPRLNALKLDRPATSIRAGIDPEALPKPPKSFT